MLKRFKLIILPALLLGGCAGFGPGPDSRAEVKVETLPTAVATVHHTGAYLEQGQLIVSGVVRRLYEVKLPGHVDVTLVGPEGVIEGERVDVAGLASNRKGAMEVPFAARFGVLPSPQSRIVVRYHDRFDASPCPGQG